MYGWEPRVLLRHYLEQGLSKTAIAERIGISRRCIYRWIAHGDLDRDNRRPRLPRGARKAPRVLRKRNAHGPCGHVTA
jgi:transposase